MPSPLSGPFLFISFLFFQVLLFASAYSRSSGLRLSSTSPALTPPMARGSLPKHPVQLLVIPVRSLSPQPRHPHCTTARFTHGLWLLARSTLPHAIAHRPQPLASTPSPHNRSSDIGSTVAFCNTNPDVAHAGLLCPQVPTSLVTPFLSLTSINLYATINTT
ncbi:hypothetical protein BU15DRAFT_68151 [Melanogaster broomeanus]|nr:hypothetical protein BU15DRAFT_68151 [Melanogaster broomeanus]